MNLDAINEKRTFHLTDEQVGVYMECLRYKMKKKAPISAYHYHDNIELLFCIEGEIVVTLPSERIILNAGDFIYLAPNTPHATSSISDTNEHICIKFLPEIISVPASRKIPPASHYILNLDDYKVFRVPDKDRNYISNLFVSSSVNYSHTDYFKRLIFRANIMLLMSYVFSNSITVESKSSQKNIPSVFLNVLKYIDENTATISLEEAADYCSLSYSYFSRTFKSIFKISFSNYVIKKRISNSLKLMQETNLSLNDIALECGFANLSHFIKCFSAEKGMTPKQFRAITTPK
ncbi:MAG: AraC family transcriptional regulator [Clostridia bacterium]|nr:AraC family transcriptional regulator [Clostridia bacterium]